MMQLICLLDELAVGFCYSDLTLESGGFELASAITLDYKRTKNMKSCS